MWARLNASVTGHIAFDPNPSASRWYSSRPLLPSVGPPENTVRIVTFWPSSRRLAMSPPQESAASSGCGATNTWVMAGRVYQAAPCRRLAREPLRADQGHEHARSVVPLGPLVAVPRDEQQVL